MVAATAAAPVVAPTDLTKLFATIQKSVSALSTSIKAFEKDIVEASSNDAAENPFAYPDGISLLTVKNDAMLDYLHHIVAVCISKISGRSLDSSSSSDAHSPADLVQNLVKLRLMLEKLRPLENRLKYQMDKLLRAAADADKEVMLGRAKPATKSKKSKDGDSDEDEDVSDDDLAFRPNPGAFMQDKARTLATKSSKSSSRRRDARNDSSDEDGSDEDAGGKTAVYRPPKLVPMSYDPMRVAARRTLVLQPTKVPASHAIPPCFPILQLECLPTLTKLLPVVSGLVDVVVWQPTPRLVPKRWRGWKSSKRRTSHDWSCQRRIQRNAEGTKPMWRSVVLVSVRVGWKEEDWWWYGGRIW